MTPPTGPSPGRDRPAAHWDYIRVPELLALQGGREGEENPLSTDEVVFITVNQVYELWFQIVLKDVGAARDLFAQPQVPEDAMAGACPMLERVRTIFHLAIDHLRLLGTLTGRDYVEFRDKLLPAHGGQSAQFREIEILLGLEEDQRVPDVMEDGFPDGFSEADLAASWAHRRVEARLADRPTLKDAIYEWLYHFPINGSRPGDPGDEEVVGAFLASYMQSHAAAQQELFGHLDGFPAGDEAARLRERYEAQGRAATRFFRGGDVSEQDRSRRNRIRAAALFIETYRELPLLDRPREVLDAIVALEQAFVAFCRRHARAVGQLIGRADTDDSTGIQDLDEVAQRYRIFSDLWQARMLLVKREFVADPIDSASYGFRADD